MKFFFSVVLTVLLSFISGLYMPWWGFAVVSFGVSALIGQKPGWSFLSGFIALLLLWGLLAYWIDSRNGGILSRKVAQIIPLGGSSLLLIAVTAFIGALVGGGAALAGSYLTGKARPAAAVEPE